MPRLFVDNLTVIDCSILDPDRGLIGESWSVDIELFGELDHQSMVFDFAKVKKTIKRIIDNDVDHKLVIPTKFAGCKTEESADKSTLSISFTDNKHQHIDHSSPIEAVCSIDAEQINSDAVIDFLSKRILKALPDNVQNLCITLHEEAATGNYYRYSHGLKKHDGNCQRIAHGHRSQVQIWHNQQRDDALEKRISEKWHDIYLATHEDLIQESESHLRFAYHTDQGYFEISLPKHRVHIMHCDSTVECIANHLLELLEHEDQAGKFKVKAFEGIGKGAIAQSSID